MGDESSQHASPPLRVIPHVYSVPQRFGLTSIFGFTTLMAFLFGSLRRLDAVPAVYFCLSLTTFAICLVQMFHGRSPRLASAATGAVALPFSFLLSLLFWPTDDADAAICGMFALFLFGILVGYLSGACLAGVFLVQDLVESFFAGRSSRNDYGKSDSPDATGCQDSPAPAKTR